MRENTEDINAWIDQRENKMKYFVHNEHVQKINIYLSIKNHKKALQ